MRIFPHVFDTGVGSADRFDKTFRSRSQAQASQRKGPGRVGLGGRGTDSAQTWSETTDVNGSELPGAAQAGVCQNQGQALPSYPRVRTGDSATVVGPGLATWEAKRATGGQQVDANR